MIVFKSPFVLSAAAAGIPLKHARIGWHTYIRDRAAIDVTVSSEATGAPKDAPLRPDTFEFWQPTALPATWKVDLGSPRDVDYVGIAGHTFGTDRCAVEVKTSTENAAFTTFSGPVLPADNAPLLFLDTSRVARWVQLSITGASIMPRIAVVYAGVVLPMQRSIYGGHAPLPLSRETVLFQSLSRGGQFLGQNFRRHGVKGSASFRHLTAEWYRLNFDPFVKAARKFPYFFAWRPETHPKEIAYVWTGEDIAPQNQGIRDFMSVAWNMSGIGNE